MESLPNTPLLEFPPNTLYAVRELVGLAKPGEMSEAVNILDQWVKKQDHFLKKDFSKEYLERAILLSKGSIEKAKKGLDRLCTMKTLMPKFFAYSNILEELPDLLQSGWCTILPKLTPDLHRVIIIKLKNTDFLASQLVQILYIFIIMLEYMKAHDYCAGYILVSDYRDINVRDLVTKFDLIELQRFITIFMEGYGGRLKGLIWLTESKVIHGFITVLKGILSEKIVKRIQVFPDLESLHNYCPKEILPLDYGGPDKCLEELNNNFVKILSSKEHVEYMKEMNEAKTDETKRTVDVFNEQYMGMAGTFRTLQVD